jgi:hypothetical protein
VSELIAKAKKAVMVYEDEKESPTMDLVLSMRQMARGMFNGDKIYHFYLGSSSTINTLSTTGTLNSIVNFYADMENSGNWTALAGLFDEFAFVQVELSLVPSSPAFNVSSPTPTIFAFDDDGLATGTLTYAILSSYPSSRFVCPAVQGSTLGTEANSTSMHPYVMKHRRPYPLGTGPVVNAPSTGWVDVGTPSNLLGSWIGYNMTLNTSNGVSVYTYLAQYEVAFRFVR